MLILVHLAIGFVTIVLAVDEDVAAGKVAFAGDAWRVVLGAAGLFMAYRAGRALVRTINAATIELGPEHFRRARVNGTIALLIGAGFLLASWNHDLAEESIAFSSWAKPVYVSGGLLMILTGLLQFVRPATTPRQYPSSNE